MSTSTLSIPPRTYQIGTTSGQRSLPGGQTYSHADVTVDFSPWTNPATTLVEIVVEFSLDGGVTWQHLVSFTQTTPPPYQSKTGGTTSSTTAPWDSNIALNPTNIRGTVNVQGIAVPLGTITLNAS